MIERLIQYAYYDPNWSHSHQAISLLDRTQRKTPEDYEHEMRGHLFCPSCYTPISIRPINTEVTSNGRRRAFFHLPSYSEIYCPLRSRSAPGRRYASETEAQQAIQNHQLAVISGFMNNEPENQNIEDPEYTGPNENIDGPIIQAPIGRHRGENYALPSKISTVAGLCRNFDENYYKYIYIANSGQVIPKLFRDLLSDVNDIEGEIATPAFYWGKILRIDRFSNTAHIYFRLNTQNSISDVRIKVKLDELDRKNITDNQPDRIVIFYGPIKEVGSGYWSDDVKWGEYALLPEQYNYLLITP
ncbi:hypothetical protein I5F94_03290 [Proteus mirabilis]|uniref:hypothetical protein n=2 Tax=Proteus mirabilis TaxID=584 RepID=UPI000880BD2C|nr:hypothetical protein [Proteus mirabilis]MBG2969310.1 hypothetical protein [Proteus mirabilis]MBG6040478.1 hypothetical protein [Proteus mirabilis]MCU9563807.1 hypothetical protein [Proteus mirabilis]MDC5877590.1 hypothetical protein [Proteus mirabilis]MDC5894537.1 hypothetical protein [Proteus mirabilis]